jgi:uncharacterized protein with LGFP repeats
MSLLLRSTSRFAAAAAVTRPTISSAPSRVFSVCGRWASKESDLGESTSSRDPFRSFMERSLNRGSEQGKEESSLDRKDQKADIPCGGA